jgi:sigma-B regulation protein RsbU (phosphoserine phosphatase)
VSQSFPPSGEQLALLYRLTQKFSSSLDLDEVLDQVMDEVIAVMHAERGFMMLHEPDGSLVFQTARGMDHSTIEEPDFQVSRGIVEQVAHQGKPMLTSDAQEDQRLMMRHSVMNLGLRSVLCVPLQVKGKTTGVIYVDNRLRAGIFTQADLELLSAIASSAAIAIENARLYQVAVEKGRMERELQMAYRVQASLLPERTPEVPGWDFAAHWQPAREVAGDYYDFLAQSASGIGLVIADVTDKGMPAALFMAFTRSIVRASLDRAASPAEGIGRANYLISAESTYDFFVTLFYACLDPSSGEMAYVNAGHNPPLLCRSGQAQFESLTRSGIPLGIEPDSTYEQKTVVLAAGDFLLLYTDGVIEAFDLQGQEFGLARLEAVLRENRSRSAGEIIEAIGQAVSAFVGAAIPSDDITMVLVKRV